MSALFIYRRTVAQAKFSTHIPLLSRHVDNTAVLVKLNVSVTLKNNKDVLLVGLKSQVTVLERGPSIYSDILTD